MAAARAGWVARVFEQAPGFSEVGAGLQIAPNCTRILDAYGLLHEAKSLGVLPEVMARARRARHVGCIGPRGGRIDVPGTLAVLPRRELDFIVCRNAVDAGTLTLEVAVEELVYDLLSDTHSGWQDNDGAYGEFCIDARARTIHLEFNERFTSSELYTHDF